MMILAAVEVLYCMVKVKRHTTVHASIRPVLRATRRYLQMVRCSLARLADCLSARTHYLHVSAGDGAAAAAVTPRKRAIST